MSSVEVHSRDIGKRVSQTGGRDESVVALERRIQRPKDAIPGLRPSGERRAVVELHRGRQSQAVGITLWRHLETIALDFGDSRQTREWRGTIADASAEDVGARIELFSERHPKVLRVFIPRRVLAADRRGQRRQRRQLDIDPQHDHGLRLTRPDIDLHALALAMRGKAR